MAYKFSEFKVKKAGVEMGPRIMKAKPVPKSPTPVYKAGSVAGNALAGFKKDVVKDRELKAAQASGRGAAGRTRRVYTAGLNRAVEK